MLTLCQGIGGAPVDFSPVGGPAEEDSISTGTVHDPTTGGMIPLFGGEAPTMKILKAFVGVALLLSFCGCAKDAVTADQTPAATSEAKVAEKTPAREMSLEPVKEGDHYTFTDPEYGYSISYPEDFYFDASPELEKQVEQFSKDNLDLDMPKSVGIRCFVFRYKPQSVEFNPNLNCVVEKVPQAMGNIDTKQYTTLARGILEKQLKANIKGESTPEMVNGKEFYRTDYTFLLPGTELVLKSRAYTHYDPSQRVAFGFTLGTVEGDKSDDMDELDKVFHSVKMP